jgi:signal transduction histidine kinase
VEPVRESVSVESLLTSLTAQFQAEAASRKIGIELDDRAGGVTIEADRRLLDQALSNLLRNALEVTPAGGRVTLRAAMDPNGQWLHFEIDDDGPGLNGIPPEDLFRPFFTTKDRGTGLGLAQARKITELHGGRLLALAGSRGGALFRLELPSKERPV